jgi:hypothetical protein
MHNLAPESGDSRPLIETLNGPLNDFIALEISMDDGSCYPTPPNGADDGRHYFALEGT